MPAGIRLSLEAHEVRGAFLRLAEVEARKVG
jgi:hypothetical protein